MLLGTVAALAVSAGAAAALSGGPGKESSSTALGLASTTPSTAPAVAAARQCGPSTETGVVRGNGPGGTDSGPAAILAFEHSYYVLRNGAKAREVVTEDAAVSDADRIQAGANSIPLGTTHCVVIRPEAPGQFLVELTEFRPGGTNAFFRQRITTTVRDGRTLITSINRA
ncbi:hypothetical protein [Nocardia sp. CY41]|uniref:hypothetical protein n=1 Tax=Nocardia sp. CY41 TaxID=2608686 RepID=UPI00135C532D|nr:hypothetical protein [Nocardia sp. CY41]